MILCKANIYDNGVCKRLVCEKGEYCEHVVVITVNGFENDDDDDEEIHNAEMYDEKGKIKAPPKYVIEALSKMYGL